VARGGVVGHVLDQPGDVERVADHTGGADQVALPAGKFGELAKPGVGLRDVEAAEQDVERADGAGEIVPGDVGEGVERLGGTHARGGPGGPEAAFGVGVGEAGAELGKEVGAAELAGGAVGAGTD
jgi:hypothetical protein